MKTKAKTLGALLAAGCLCSAWAARADETPAELTPMPLFGGDVQFRSNYVARGISQSQGQPSAQGEIDYNPGDGVYGGMDGSSINWINQLHPGDNVSMDADAWLGYRRHLDPGWTVKAGFMRIQFPGHYVQQSPPADQPNTTEAFGSVAWNDLSAQLSYAVTNYVGTPDSKGSIYMSVAASHPISESWTLGVHLGRTTEPGHNPITGRSNSHLNYTDYKLSIACDLGSGISLTLAHTWTNADPAIYILNGYAVGGHHTWMSLEKDF